MHRPQEIQKNSLYFCKISLTIILWLAVIIKSVWLLILVLTLLAFSAILGVDKSPTIVLGNLIMPKGKTVILDKNGMRFAHSIGTFFALICTIFVLTGVSFAWPVTIVFAIIKTINLFGLCPAEKAYKCMTNGGSCCAFLKK